jgi:TRAP-type transport system periplasmic protein
MRVKRLITAALLFSLALAAAPLQAATFKIATIAPDGTSWMNEMRAGAEEIKKRTEGRVNFRFYPGGIMGNDNSVLRKIRVGQLHGGALTGGGLADILPEAQVYSLPFIFRDYAEVDYVRKQMDPVLMQQLEKVGYVGFGISEGGFAYLMSDTAVSGAEALKGHKIWVPEGDLISRTAFESAGVSPIPLPLTDVLTGLQTGLVDTVAATPTGAIALQWHTRVHNLTDVPLMYIYGTMVVKRNAFERLSNADQKVVRDVMGDIFVRLNQQNRADNNSAMNALRAQGITFVPSNIEKRREWQGIVGGAMDKLIAKRLFDPAIHQRLLDYLDAYRAQAVNQ